MNQCLGNLTLYHKRLPTAVETQNSQPVYAITYLMLILNTIIKYVFILAELESSLVCAEK